MLVVKYYNDGVVKEGEGGGGAGFGFRRITVLTYRGVGSSKNQYIVYLTN